MIRTPHRPRSPLGECLRAVVKSLAPLCPLVLLVIPASLRSAEPPPNFIIILADDLGWADLPLYGNRFHETPALDRLAFEGMRFTQFYASAVCSPTRANLQSGQNEARFGITQHIPGHRRPFARLVDPPVPTQLPLEVETFAQRLGTVGYVSGYFGKWHLGGAGFGPAAQGWQEVFEHIGHSVPPEKTGEPGPRRTAAYLTERAIRFIEEHREAPFVVQVSHYAVHIPLQVLPQLERKYREKPPMPGHPSRPDYAALLEELDQSVAALVEAVDRLGLGERTLIFFVSDNGGLVHDQSGNVYTSNAPLRGEKGMVYEGGIRVPAIARWPGTIPAATVNRTPATTTDLFPTLLELAGLASPESHLIDGVSIAPLLRDPAAEIDRKSFFWHLPHYHHGRPASAVRAGDLKLIEHYEDGSLELYDLELDPGETTDLSTARPQDLARLHAEMIAWRERTSARLPKPNPGFDLEREAELSSRQAPAETRAMDKNR